MTKLVTVVGARPQFVKAAVLSRLLRTDKFCRLFEEFLVHTGQHYDQNMSEIFFREMMIPKPDINLMVGSGTHGKMTGEMIIKIESVLMQQEPDLVLVYGDTNSTLAGALAASKMQIPVAHIEAGLRSYFKAMPEEQNRVLTDHVSSYLFCPTATAVSNLKKEGIASASNGNEPTSDKPFVANVGDVMLDASLFYREMLKSRKPSVCTIRKLGVTGSYRLLTLHRSENTDDGNRMRSIFAALNHVDNMQIVFPIHPRTLRKMKEIDIPLGKHIMAIEPVGYFDMLVLEENCDCIITDSGGIQKEAYFFGKPCITLRDQTEWTESVELGWNVLAGTGTEKIAFCLKNLPHPIARGNLYGSGNAGEMILDLLSRNFT